METKRFCIVVFILVIIGLLWKCDEPKDAVEVITKTDTVYFDTLYIDTPIYDTIYKDRQRIIRVAAEDVDISESDSIFLLAETKHYKDSMYEAWVSGYEPSLDSIRVFNRYTTRTITREVPVYKIPQNDRNVSLGGFVSVNSGFNLNHLNLRGGIEMNLNRFNVKAGYNIGEASYPFAEIAYNVF